MPRQEPEAVRAINALIVEGRLDSDMFILDGSPVPIEQFQLELRDVLGRCASDLVNQPDDPEEERRAEG